MSTFLNNYAVSLITIIGLIVLVAIGKLNTNIAVPLITALAGVHIGQNNPTSPPPPQQPVPQPPTPQPPPTPVPLPPAS